MSALGPQLLPYIGVIRQFSEYGLTRGEAADNIWALTGIFCTPQDIEDVCRHDTWVNQKNNIEWLEAQARRLEVEQEERERAEDDKREQAKAERAERRLVKAAQARRARQMQIRSRWQALQARRYRMMVRGMSA